MRSQHWASWLTGIGFGLVSLYGAGSARAADTPEASDTSSAEGPASEAAASEQAVSEQPASGEAASDQPAGEAEAEATGSEWSLQSPLGFRGSVTGQWFWLQDKAMPGIELAVGKGLWEGDLEVSFLTLTHASSDIDGSLLGNQLGLYFMASPLRSRFYEVSFGLGADIYLLWGIHSDAREVALAPRVVVRLWPLEDVALSFSARSYLVHSDGLDLGTAHDGSAGSPILLSAGITWGFR